MDWRWPNFSPSEFICSHCGTQAMRASTLDMLQGIRAEYGKPLVVTSAYRCKDHPIEKAKAYGPGAHAFGAAIDLRAIGSEAYRLVELGYRHGATGVGVSQHRRGARFVHIDNVQPGEFGLVRPTMWSY